MSSTRRPRFAAAIAALFTATLSIGSTLLMFDAEALVWVGGFVDIVAPHSPA